MTSPGGKEVGRISIRVVPDTSKFRTELKAQLEEIERTIRGKVHVDLELDANGIRQKVEAATAGLDKSAKVNLDLDSAAFAIKFAKLRAQLAKDAKINVEVDVDQNRLQRTLSGIGDKISGIFSSKGGTGGGGIPLGSFADTAAVIAAVAALAAPALALLSGALISLPALLAAIVVPIGAVALGLDGLKKAAEVVQPDLDALKATMSQRFQDVFTPILEKAKSLFPALQQSLPGVATALGTVADAFVSTLTSQSGLDRIKSTIGSIAKAISDSAPGIGNFTDGFLTLVDKVAAKLPGLSNMINGWGDSFNNWVNKITTKDWFGKSPLDRGLTSFKETIQEILNLAGDLLNQGFKFLSDPNFGQSMKDFVADVKDVVNNVLPGLGKFFQDITSALNGINSLIDKINGFKPPSWMDLGGKPAGDNGTIPGTKNSFSPGVLKDNPWTETQQSFEQFTTLAGVMMDQLWAKIKGGAAEAFANVAAIGAGMWNTITGTAAAAWNGVVGIVAGVVSQVIGTLAQVPTALQGAWANLQGIAAQAWNSVVSTVANVLSQVVATVVQGGSQVVAEVASWPGKIAAALAGLAAAGAEAGRALVQGLIGGIGSLIGSAIAKAKELASSVANAAKSALGINSPSKVFFDIGDNVGQGLANGIGGQTENVVSTIKEILQAVKDVFGNASGLALNFNLGAGTTALKTDMASIADSSQTFQKNLTTGLPGVGKVSAEARQQLDELALQKDQLELQRQQLQNEKNLTGDKGQKSALQQQIDALTLQKKQLDVQSQQLENASKYGDQLGAQNQQYDEMLKKVTNIPIDFAKATGQQAMQDLGISGQGAIPQALEQAWQFGSQFIFNVSNIDEAMAVKNNQTNKQALQFTQR
jgi:hypothetical protein